MYQQIKKVDGLSEVFGVTDDKRISDVCEKKNILFVIKRNDYENHVTRLAELANKTDADYYVCVNGDELLILP